ncbi:MAG: orotidine-5'-phosphate decarboxylase [Burkholderiaceae bacterium]|jgi:orotidine-5'-phosphate decarboxylase
MTTTFTDRLQNAWRQTDSMLCVGLDPDLARLPAGISRDHAGIERFCMAIVDATAEFACAFKPQIAYFAALGLEAVLERLIQHIRQAAPQAVVVLDAKRGDIGATARQYAREAFERYAADAVTLSPYMGSDSIEPYFDYPDRGIFLLCRTSNPGGNDLQFLTTADGTPVYQHVARRAAQHWNQHGQTGLVVGATYPEELATVRALVGDMPLLVPGIGAQGGNLAAVMRSGCDRQGHGLLINAARAILYAGAGTDFAVAARHAAADMAQAIRQRRPEPTFRENDNT